MKISYLSDTCLKLLTIPLLLLIWKFYNSEKFNKNPLIAQKFTYVDKTLDDLMFCLFNLSV